MWISKFLQSFQNSDNVCFSSGCESLTKTDWSLCKHYLHLSICALNVSFPSSWCVLSLIKYRDLLPEGIVRFPSLEIWIVNEELVHGLGISSIWWEVKNNSINLYWKGDQFLNGLLVLTESFVIDCENTSALSKNKVNTINWAIKDRMYIGGSWMVLVLHLIYEIWQGFLCKG